MKLFLSVFFLVALGAQMAHGQNTATKEQGDLAALSSISQEKMFVHLNSTLLFPAEYLYYTVYCLNEKGTGYSGISKVAYVELIGEDLVPVFKHKIKLENGLGQGDFFLPTTVPSGNYKLIAYTNWMKNQGKDHFFQTSMAVINPYQQDQRAILPTRMPNDSLTDSLKIEKAPARTAKEEILIDNAGFELSMASRSFGKRKKVTFSLINSRGADSVPGTYSISVRHKDNLPRLPRPRAIDYSKIYDKPKQREMPRTGADIFLPELRGELFSGKIVDQNSDPMPNIDVALSLPGEEYAFWTARSKGDGSFFMNINGHHTSDEAIVQCIGKNGQDCQILMDEHRSVDYAQLVFDDFKIDGTMAGEILKRSVHNQIESAYFGFRPDSLLQPDWEPPFLKDNKATYDLDEYAPFKTVREAILEIVKDVWARRGKEGKEELEIKSMDLVSNYDFLPMVIVDGAIVQDHGTLLNMDAQHIRKIQVYRDRYVFGPQIYQGAIIFLTANGEGARDYIGTRAHLVKMFRPGPEKKYFIQNYDEPRTAALGNLPDDRLQLAWIPKIQIEGNKGEFSFFTSDVPGEFEISIEGFMATGVPISLAEVFRVQQD